MEHRPDHVTSHRRRRGRELVMAEVVAILEGTIRWPGAAGVLEGVVARVPGVAATEGRLTAPEPPPRRSNLAPRG